MKHVPLPDNVIIHVGHTDLFVVTFADFTSQTTANTPLTLNLLTLALGDTVHAVQTYLKTSFKNSADAAFNTDTTTIGDTGSANRYITSQELNANGTVVVTKTNATTTPFVYTAADTLQMVLNAMAAKSLSQLDTGELHIYARISRMARLTTLV